MPMSSPRIKGLLVLLVQFILFRSFASETMITQDLLINMKLDTTWVCSKEKADNMCEQYVGNSKAKKMIIWTAKAKGSADTFEQYRDHLEHPILLDFKGKRVPSKVKYLRTIMRC